MKKEMPKDRRINISLFIIIIVLAILPLELACYISFFKQIYADGPAEAISLLLAYYTLITTIVLTITIFEKQVALSQDKEEKAIKHAKILMGTEINVALENLIIPTREYRTSYIGRNMQDIYIDHIDELKEALPDESFKHLSVISQYINACATEEDGDLMIYEGYSLLFRDWVEKLMKSNYGEYYSLVFDYKDLLNKRTFDLISCLEDNSAEYDRNLYTIRSTEGGKVYEYSPEDMRYKVYEGEKIVLDGTLKWNEGKQKYMIYDGYDSTSEYKGNYKNGEYNGQGTLYGEEGRKKADGEWQNGKLLEGTKYSGVYFIDSKGKFNKKCEHVDELMEWLLFGNYDDDIREITRYSICDRIIKNGGSIGYGNIRSMLEFLADDKMARATFNSMGLGQ